MILIYIEQSEGVPKKTSLEAISYGVQLSKILNIEAVGLIIGKASIDTANISNVGLPKIIQRCDENIAHFDSQQFSEIITETIEKLKITYFIISNNQIGKSVAPRVACKIQAGLVSNVIELPASSNVNTFKKIVFSGKAFSNVTILTEKKVISISPNSFSPIIENVQTEVIQEDNNISKANSKLIKKEKTSGTISLTEADIVVSGGRGLKGPENWFLIEDLAKVLGAATACSRPVADSDWRPHHEHVGQTGIQISPNLYIAIGISGAIQHLAGVNRSKIIVVINKDPEAPFIKAANYAIIGDAFEIVPKLTEALKLFKNQS